MGVDYFSKWNVINLIFVFFLNFKCQVFEMTQDDGQSGCLILISLCTMFFSGTLYDGEKFQLEFKFGSKYPFESPEV